MCCMQEAVELTVPSYICCNMEPQTYMQSDMWKDIMWCMTVCFMPGWKLSSCGTVINNLIFEYLRDLYSRCTTSALTQSLWHRTILVEWNFLQRGPKRQLDHHHNLQNYRETEVVCKQAVWLADKFSSFNSTVEDKPHNVSVSVIVLFLRNDM